MKKFFCMFSVLVAGLLLACTAPAFAAFTGPGVNSNTSVTPVKKASQVAGAAEKTICLLEGNVVEQIAGKKDRYTFKDDSGTAVVEIKWKLLRFRDITPTNRVRICGDVDLKKDGTKEVEVDWLEILK